MSAFSETVSALLAERQVALSILVHFDFKTDPKRVHLGYGPLRAGGHVWEGIGQAGSASGLEAPMAGTAPQATFTLSGVDTANLAATLGASDEVKGRDVTVFLQFFDEDRKRLDQPYAVYFGVMDVISYKPAGPSLATVSVTAESLFTRRSKPLWGSLSDRDQKRLYPGDRGLEFVAQMANKKAYWPIILSRGKD